MPMLYKPKGGYSHLLSSESSKKQTEGISFRELVYRIMSWNSYGGGELESMRQEIDKMKELICDLAEALPIETQRELAAKQLFYLNEGEQL